MDGYKKLIRSKNFRKKLIQLLSFIPDKPMLKLQYRIKTHRKLHLDNPKRWTEKSQWYKLYYRDPLMIKCVDKYTVREYIEQKGYGHLLNELYWVGESLDDVDLDSLPDRFVIKVTSGSGTNIIVKDKSKFDLAEARQKTEQWMKDGKIKPLGREWPYYYVEPRIIIEKYMEESEKGLIDYKFFCFGRKISHLLVISDRFSAEKLDLYSPEWERLKVIQFDCPNQSTENLPKPENWDEMLEIARNLGEDFPHVRVDLYNIKGKIIFGELTFFSGSGYYVYEPDSFDEWLGDWFTLPEVRKLTDGNELIMD